MVGQVVNDKSNSQKDIQNSQQGHNDVSEFPSVCEKGILIWTMKTLDHKFNAEQKKSIRQKGTVKAK